MKERDETLESKLEARVADLSQPSKTQPLHLNARYTLEQFEMISRGIGMVGGEQRWFGLYRDPWVYIIHKSGEIALGARFERDVAGMKVAEAWSTKSEDWNGGPEHDGDLLTTLMDRHAGKLVRRLERVCVRALILSPRNSVLLVHLVLPNRHLWITPGGGVAPNESHLEALHRELLEETGQSGLTIGPHIWIREGAYEWRGETRAEREYFYLVRADEFVADSSGNPVPGERELMAEFRWWPARELPAESRLFAPMRLGALVADLIRNGAPAPPIDTGY
jgi:8-oxo-dGTP pyrophosphatase MutT (NUDIX family)